MPNSIPFCGNCKFNLRQKEESTRPNSAYMITVGRCVRNHARSNAPIVREGDFCGEFVQDIDAEYTSLEHWYTTEYEFDKAISPNIKMMRGIGREGCEYVTSVDGQDLYLVLVKESTEGTERFDKEVTEAQEQVDFFQRFHNKQ